MVAFAVVASGITSAATLSRAFGGDYLSEFVDLEVLIAAIALVLLIALLNLRGISESVKVNVVFTAAQPRRLAPATTPAYRQLQVESAL